MFKKESALYKKKVAKGLLQVCPICSESHVVIVRISRLYASGNKRCIKYLLSSQ